MNQKVNKVKVEVKSGEDLNEPKNLLKSYLKSKEAEENSGACINGKE